jgi:hypothetical protein
MRGRGLVLMSILVSVAAVAAIAFLANRDDRSRNDAMLFLDRYRWLDVDDPLEERRARVDALASIPLSSPEVGEVRDLCVSAHRTLIRAEEHSAAAREALAQATAGGAGEESMPDEVRARIEADLATSDEAIALAREQLPRCLDRARRLELRFQPRPPR